MKHLSLIFLLWLFIMGMMYVGMFVIGKDEQVKKYQLTNVK